MSTHPRPKKKVLRIKPAPLPRSPRAACPLRRAPRSRQKRRNRCLPTNLTIVRQNKKIFRGNPLCSVGPPKRQKQHPRHIDAYRLHLRPSLVDPLEEACSSRLSLSVRWSSSSRWIATKSRKPPDSSVGPERVGRAPVTSCHRGVQGWPKETLRRSADKYKTPAEPKPSRRDELVEVAGVEPACP